MAGVVAALIAHHPLHTATEQVGGLLAPSPHWAPMARGLPHMYLYLTRRTVVTHCGCDTLHIPVRGPVSIRRSTFAAVPQNRSRSVKLGRASTVTSPPIFRNGEQIGGLWPYMRLGWRTEWTSTVIPRSAGASANAPPPSASGAMCRRRSSMSSRNLPSVSGPTHRTHESPVYHIR